MMVNYGENGQVLEFSGDHILAKAVLITNVNCTCINLFFRKYHDYYDMGVNDEVFSLASYCSFFKDYAFN